MIIDRYSYIVKPELTNDLIYDLSQYLIANNKLNTYKHVQEVDANIIMISEMYNLDLNKLRIAAYAHDIANIMNSSDMLEYIQNEELTLDDAEKKYPFLLHQRFSKMILEEHFQLRDEVILSMVECHTTLKAKANQYDLALFIADKLTWDQDGLPPYYEEVKQALSISLERAAISYIDYIFINELVLYPHSQLLEARRYLKEKF